MLEKDQLDQLQSLAKIASDKEIGEIPANLLSKDELKLIKKAVKDVAKCKKKGQVVTCIFEIWYPLGKIAHKLQWYKEAEICYRAVIEHNPQFPDGWYYLGLLMSARGRDVTAREMFHIALDKAPPTWNKLNRVKLLTGQKPVNDQQPDIPQRRVILQQEQPKTTPIRAKWSRSRPPPKPAIIKTGKCAICEIGVGNLGFTCHFCGREFCTDHRLPEKHTCTGRYRVTILREKQVPTDPLEIITELHRIGKASAEKTWVNVSSINIVEFDFDILKHAHKRLMVNEYEGLPQANDFNLWFNVGKVAHHFRFLEIAEGFYRKALVFDTKIEVYENLGLVLKEQGKWEEAEEWFRKLIALDPEYTNAWMNLGKVLDAQNRVDEAKLAFENALRQDPKKIRELLGDRRWSYAVPEEKDDILLEQMRGGRQTSGLWFSLGNNFYQRGMLKEAEDAYQKGLRLDPRADFAWNNLGLIFLETGRFEEAEKHFLRAIELNPNIPTPYSNLGYVYREQERNDEALKVLQKVTERFPKDVWGWLGFGTLLINIGRKAEGENALEKAFAIEPDLRQYLPFILQMLGSRGKRKTDSPPPGMFL